MIITAMVMPASNVLESPLRALEAQPELSETTGSERVAKPLDISECEDTNPLSMRTLRVLSPVPPSAPCILGEGSEEVQLYAMYTESSKK